MKFQGITKAEYRDKGSADPYVEITDLVAEGSVLARPLSESEQDTSGGDYFGGFQPKATVKFLGAAQHAALLADYAADQRVDLQVTTTDGTTEVVTGLPKTYRDDVAGKQGGRVVYVLEVTGFSTAAAA